MQEEFDALIGNGTWDLVPRPTDQNIIRTKWVYKIKQKVDGRIDCYKARLVARGFQQVDGVDFVTPLSPGVPLTTHQPVETCEHQVLRYHIHISHISRPISV